MLTRVLGALSSRLAAGVDEMITRTALQGSGPPPRQRSRELSPAERLEALAAIREAYGDPGLITSPERFFVDPPVSEGRLTRVRQDDLDVVVDDLRWRSAYEPFGQGVAARYRSHEENGVAVARLIRRPHETRPAVVVIHGYLGGELRVEESFWPVSWLLKQGLDVALFVLPFHGERRRDRRSRPVFPSNDPRFTIEGFRQAVHDIRWLMRWLRERGAPAVGALGMSLGGYTTALLTTVEAELAFAGLLVPLASLADFARDGGRFTGTDDERTAQHQGLEEAMRVVSPFARPSRLPSERLIVLGGEADRITPVAHAERLAEHLGAPLERFAGGHVLQLGRARAFDALGRVIDRTVGESARRREGA